MITYCNDNAEVDVPNQYLDENDTPLTIPPVELPVAAKHANEHTTKFKPTKATKVPHPDKQNSVKTPPVKKLEEAKVELINTTSTSSTQAPQPVCQSDAIEPEKAREDAISETIAKPDSNANLVYQPSRSTVCTCEKTQTQEKDSRETSEFGTSNRKDSSISISESSVVTTPKSVTSVGQQKKPKQHRVKIITNKVGKQEKVSAVAISNVYHVAFIVQLKRTLWNVLCMKTRIAIFLIANKA